MSCAEAQRLIFVERDGPLDPTQQARLDDHVARCPACERLQASFARSVDSWRVTTATVTVPDATREWHALRRRMRAEPARGWQRFFRPVTIAWVGLPAAAAAALAFAFYSPSPSPAINAPSALRTAAKAPEIARADFVDVPSNSASTMVYVDNTSGWLVVWADTPGKG